MKNKELIIALAGNPNSGKTTIFNNLTGGRQHVGNYPGVTVEKKEGILKYEDYIIKVVDLPGTYSLTAYSIDELVARNFIIEEKPHIVIDIIDTSNLERNLYLATLLIELGTPLILAFNMSDVAQKQGLVINKDRLSELLGVPIVFTVATKREGMEELLREVLKLAEGKTKIRRSTIDYGEEISEELKKIENILINDINLIQKYPLRWLAIKLLENDKDVIEKIKKTSKHCQEIFSQLKKSHTHLEKIFGDTVEAILADRRYGFISGACSETVSRTFELRHTISDKIDKILLNRVISLPIFLCLIWLTFKFTFICSAPVTEMIEIGKEKLSNLCYKLLPGGYLQSLVVDGIIGGVGNVIVFVPMIFLLFLAIALLEDTGYMARAAFIMDKLMHKMGLHGRSFIPLFLGFGCNLPAIMATRTIEDKRDRMVTILINSFISCSARLPVYALFIGAFFPATAAGNVLFSIYILGIMVAIMMAKIFRKYLFKGETAPFVMELPPYRMPTIRGLLIHMWERGVIFLKKVGTVIFLGSIVVWFLSSFPLREDKKNIEGSFAATIGKAITPVFEPLGFDDWRISVSLLSGFAAKEIIVATLGTLYSSSSNEGNIEKHRAESLQEVLRKQKRQDGSKLYTPLVAYTLMAFVLLYMPCLGTIAIIKRETGSWLWPLFAIFYTTTVAWLVAFFIYQGGKIIGLD